MWLIAQIAAAFIRLTAADGLPLDLNADQIVAVRPPRDQETRTMHKGANCIIFTTDAKFIGVVEDCETVKRRLGK